MCPPGNWPSPARSHGAGPERVHAVLKELETKVPRSEMQKGVRRHQQGPGFASAGSVRVEVRVYINPVEAAGMRVANEHGVFAFNSVVHTMLKGLPTT